MFFAELFLWHGFEPREKDELDCAAVSHLYHPLSVYDRAGVHTLPVRFRSSTECRFYTTQREDSLHSPRLSPFVACKPQLQKSCRRPYRDICPAAPEMTISGPRWNRRSLAHYQMDSGSPSEKRKTSPSTRIQSAVDQQDRQAYKSRRTDRLPACLPACLPAPLSPGYGWIDGRING